MKIESETKRKIIKKELINESFVIKCNPRNGMEEDEAREKQRK